MNDLTGLPGVNGFKEWMLNRSVESVLVKEKVALLLGMKSISYFSILLILTDAILQTGMAFLDVLLTV